MRGKFHNFRQAVKFPQLVIYSPLLFLCILPATLSAEGPTAKVPHCFAISVRLNGQPIDGPQVVTLKTRKTEDTVSMEQKCFQVPDAIVQSELVEVSFTVPGNNIHMADIPADFFSGAWDVELADKKFAKDVAVPKHVNASEVCAVIFHDGDQTQSLSQPQCRTPLTGK
ncbi:MAG TPA: hypothetical protein VMU45_08160 [Candidatus Eisenbacteria bacterium]|nr:hypothetical protein [Candidatus Eisenbacteria bacterium]